MKTRSHTARTAQAALIRRGIWFDRASSVEDVRSLVEALRVVPSPRPLIRLGPDIDGGYLVPDDLEGIGACISPGVSTEVGFDLDLAERGIDVFMADASVSAPPVDHPRFHFAPKFIDTYESAQNVTLDDFVRPVAPGQDLILEMDIEGAEWRVFNSLSQETLNRFRIMVVEFHDVLNLFSRFGFREINGVFRKLLETHAVVHIHPNNVTGPIEIDGLSIPSLLEFTFYRRDRGAFEPGPLAFPHPLDAPCCEGFPDYPLPACWYQQRA